MKGFVDFHTHVLPGVDDGSKDLQMSVGMLQRAWEQGITTVVATPHFYAHNDRPEDFLQRREAAEKILRQQISGLQQIPELKMGAEVYFFPGISDCGVLSKLTIDGGRCILIEMPTVPWSEPMYRELAGIYDKQGLTPIIAHIDRYTAPFRAFAKLKRLQKLPVMVQANASFFLRRSTRRMALRMLWSKEIHLLGSDCHDLIYRPPNLGDAVHLICDRLGEDAMTRVNLFGSEVLSN